MATHQAIPRAPHGQPARGNEAEENWILRLHGTTDRLRGGLAHLPVCIAKTQNSLSDDPARLGRFVGFEVTVREVRLSTGAGFLVSIAGNILTMPGLPKVPAAQSIDVDDSGRAVGLF